MSDPTYTVRMSDQDAAYIENLSLSENARARVREAIECARAEILDVIRTDPEQRAGPDGRFFTWQQFIVDAWGDDRWHRITLTVDDSNAAPAHSMSSSSTTTMASGRGDLPRLHPPPAAQQKGRKGGRDSFSAQGSLPLDWAVCPRSDSSAILWQGPFGIPMSGNLEWPLYCPPLYRPLLSRKYVTAAPSRQIMYRQAGRPPPRFIPV
jgi:hypothetical protein